MSSLSAPVLDLRLHARKAPDRPAIVCGDVQLSYGELEALANRCAGVFRRLGLVRGDHVATLLSNRPEGLAAAWAAWRSGLYLTPMSTALAPPELQYLVEDCDAKAVLVDASLRELIAALPGAVARPVHWLSLGGAVDGFSALEPLLDAASPAPHADEPPGALMMYTSGTTGAPKGVIRPLLPPEWRGTPPFAADLLDLFQVGGDDVRYLSTAPLYHAAPLRVALAVTAGGGTVFVMERFDAEEALRLIEHEGITHSQWVPSMFQRLLALPAERRAALRAPAHRIAVHGAAPCPPALKRAMIDWWGPILLEYYSGSEGVGLTLIDSVEALRKPGSVGRARKGVVHIVDADGGELQPGQTGVVYFSGLKPFAYHKAPEKTLSRTHAQGWQTFGDMGHVDDEGWLFLTDRQDDMIISGGVNIYPQEIEAAMLEVPGVWECSVVGAADERFGERPVAFIVPARDAAHDPDALVALLARVRAHNKERLGRLKQPDEIHLIDQLPRTATGKVLRRQLRDSLGKGLSGKAL
ncbi:MULTISPECIES: AMP-binding protein [unclassified Variovorax]|uniref:AMP-binding protein n=1 Tax=unclassified Variovorax TaxID=663243 RepID=UPI0008CB060C|nr:MULTISPECIES: AMP-binding protein [unclassified Variovorax]SEK16682.1 fatty-acyl-CoA synthase [Variovorax sp. OK202]SFE55158.1 fatty-acyl-CoA synthase [Variovorax sp. OK212]